MKVELSSVILAFDLVTLLSEATIKKKRAQWSDKNNCKFFIVSK